jgi:hypothetical protein
MVDKPCPYTMFGGNRFWGGIDICGLIATGETLSTGGNGAHGDFDGAGAGAVFEVFNDCFSATLFA